MARRHFQWTRKLYRDASSLSRLLSGYPYWAQERAPTLLRRYWELWEKYPQNDDKLTTPLWRRYPNYCPDDAPF